MLFTFISNDVGNVLLSSVMKPKKLSEQELKKKSVEVVSSYIFTSSSRNLSKYGERLLMEVISVAKDYILDKILNEDKLSFSNDYEKKFATIDIPIKTLLNEDDSTNYTVAKRAAVELMEIYHKVEAPILDENGIQITYANGSPQYKLELFHLLDTVKVNEKPGIVSVELGKTTWARILDMGKGYRRYKLYDAKKLDNNISIRLFQLISNNNVAIEYTIERLKEILNITDSYKGNYSNFVNRVIVPAEKEISEKTDYIITHEPYFEKQPNGKQGRPKLKGLRFMSTMKGSAQFGKKYFIDTFSVRILMDVYKFDEQEIRSNLKIFREMINRRYDLEDFLIKMIPVAKKSTNPKAFVIESIKNYLSNEKPVGQEAATNIPQINPGKKIARPIFRADKPSRLTVNDKDSIIEGSKDIEVL